MTKKATLAAAAENKKDRHGNMPELLAPAGSFEKLVTAIHYGADAIYCGGKQYGLRAHAANFSDEELKEVVAYSHQRAVKVYITVNMIAHDRDFAGLGEYLLYLREIGADAIIVSDPGILLAARRTIPEMPIHLSTQANVTNPQAALFWAQQGVSRLNLARELGLAEIGAIKQALSATGPATRVEVFVHGALCISYSGRCLLSWYLTGRDANRGDCAQPCRYQYALVEEKRPGQFFPVEEDSRGTYIFNAKDLCLINRLPELVAIGVDSLKIEGRMKSSYYVGSVVRVYRAALDYLKTASPEGRLQMEPVYAEELARTGTRGLTENFSSGSPTGADMIYGTPRLTQEYMPAGVVRRTVDCSANSPMEDGPEIEFRNPVAPGEELEYLGRGLRTTCFRITQMRSATGEAVNRANPGDRLKVRTAPAAIGLEENGLLRKCNR